MNSVEKALKVKHGITGSTGNTKKKSGGHSVASALEAYEAKYERRKQSRYDKSGLDGITEYNTSLYGDLDKVTIGTLDDKSKSEWVTRINEAKDRNNKAYTYLKDYGTSDLDMDTTDAQKYLEGVISGLDELIKALEYKAPTEADYINYLENPYTSKYRETFEASEAMSGDKSIKQPSVTDGHTLPKFMTRDFDAAKYKWQKEVASGTSEEAQEQLQELSKAIYEYEDAGGSNRVKRYEKTGSVVSDSPLSKYTDEELKAEKRRLENLYAARKAAEEYKTDSGYMKKFGDRITDEKGKYNREGLLALLDELKTQRDGGDLRIKPEGDKIYSPGEMKQMSKVSSVGADPDSAFYKELTKQIKWLEAYDYDHMSADELGGEIKKASGPEPYARAGELLSKLSNPKLRADGQKISEDLEGLGYDIRYATDQAKTDWYNRRGQEVVEKVDADPGMTDVLKLYDAYNDYLRLSTAITYDEGSLYNDGADYNKSAREAWSKVEKYGSDAEAWKKAQEEIADKYFDGKSIDEVREELNTAFSDHGYDMSVYGDYKNRLANAEMMDALKKGVTEGANEDPFVSSVLSIGTNLGSWRAWAATGISAISNIQNELGGEYLNYKPVDPNSTDFEMTAITQTIRGTVGDKIANNTDWEMWGTNISRLLYNTGMSIGDFLAATAVTGGGNAALALMGTTSAGASAYEVIQNGGSTEQAFVYGTLAGITEMMTEKFSLDGLKAFQSVEVISFKSWIMNALKQTFTEASEEAVASVADTLWDELVNGDNSAYNRTVADYMSRGYTQAQANQMAVQDKIVETMFSALGGAISGFSIGSVAGGINYMSNKNAERTVNAQIDEVFEYSAEDFDLSTHEGQIRTIELADTVERLDAEGLIPDDSDLVQRAQSIRERINNNTEFGFGKYEYQPVDQSEVRSLYLDTADIVSRDATGKLREEGEKDNSSDIDPVEKLAKDMTEAEGNATAPVQTEIPSGAMQSSFIQDDIDIDTSIAVENARPEITPSLSPVVYKGKEAKVTGVTKDGKVKLQTAEGEVTATTSEIYSDNDTAFILTNARDMGRGRELYVTMYSPKFSAEAYTKAYKKISEMVYKGEGKISTMRVVGADFADGIDADTASIVYDELVRYKRAAESKKIKGAPKDVVGSVRGRGLKKVDAEARIFLEEFAKSFKVDINVVDDTGDGSLGSTSPLSRRITLSVKSANELSTLLHESGHLMKAWDPDTFYAIQDAVCDWFAKYNNTTLEDLIESRQAEYTEKEGKSCSYQEAKDEVTCNAIEAIQTAENFAEEFTQTMADLQYPKAQAEAKLTALQKFFRKIKLALNNILDRIKNKRSGDLMITAEGKVIRKDIAMVNDLLKKVRQGLTNVRTNYDAYVAGAEVKSAVDGAEKHMYTGKMSKTSDTITLDKAETMETKGFTREEIRQATGWFRGYDGKWRFEISDKEMSFKLSDNIPRYTTVGELIDHPKLFRSYPDLKNYSIVFQKLNGARAEFDVQDKCINVDRSVINSKELKSVLIHELQHAVQHIEGFARGGSVSYWDNAKNDITESDRTRLREATEERDAKWNEITEKYGEGIADRFSEYLSANDTLFGNSTEAEMSQAFENIRSIKNWAQENGYWDDLSEVNDLERRVETIHKTIERNRNRSSGDLYYNTAGEVEARDTAYRSEYTEEQRKNIRPDIDHTDVVFADDVNVNEDIVVLENGNLYVKASRNVITGTTVAEMRRDINRFFNTLLSETNELDIPTLEGDILTISKKETRTKARDNFKMVDGVRVKLSDEEFALKLRVESHIDEIAETSKLKGSSIENWSHKFTDGSMAYRRAYFEDFDGKYYEIVFSVGQKASTTKIYNVGQIKESSLPSAKIIAVLGSKPLGNLLSNNRVPQNKQIVNTNSSTDSDTELKQHISSEAEEQAKADELLALREENKALKAMDKRRWQMIDYLQKQLDQWKRGGKKLDYRGIEKLARSLIKEYGAKVDVKAYAKELTGFFNYMTNNSNPSADVIRKRYTELAEKLIHNVEAVNPEVQEQLKNIRHIIRDGVALNVNQRGDVLHRFETMAKYREKVGGSVRITNKGIPLDDAWSELSALYPDLFPEDTTDADQPIVMAEVISMLNDNLKYNPIAEEYLGNEEAALMDAVAKIVDGFHNIPELVDANSAYKSAYAEAKAYFEQDKEKLIRMNQKNRKWYKDYYRGWYQGKLNTVAMESVRRFESYRESRAKTDERRKIKRIMNDLQKAVASPTKSRYVPTGLYTTMIEVCRSLDMGYNLDTKVGQQMDMLSNKIGDLLDEYDKLKAASGDGSSDAYEYASEYSAAIRESLATIKETMKGRSIASLTLSELMTVRTLLNDISAALRDARIQIDAEGNIENYDLGMRAYEELDKTKRFGKINLLLSGEMYTAMNFVDMICNYDPNAVLNQQMKKLEEGCRRMEEYYMEASKPFVELQERDKGKPYTDFISKGYDMGLVDENGKHVILTKAMACQIIMSWEREQANSHLVHMSDGSIKIPDLELLQKGKYKEALQKDNCHRVKFVNDSDILNLREHMDDYCKDWIAATRDYFDGMAKHRVNEVTMKLLHRVAALSENYIPYEVDQDYIHKDIEVLNHNSLLENAGILMPITPKAKQGLVMMGLNVVLNKHIDITSKLYGLAVPIRNFKKVYDTINVSEQKSLKEMINNVTKQVAHSKGTENVIEQVLAELQSGRQGGDHGAMYNWFRSNQVSAILSFKLSAALKQTTAYAVAGYKLSADALRVGQSKSFKRNLTDKSRKAWYDEIDSYTAKHFMRRQGLSTTELGDLVKMGESTKQSPLHGAKWLQAMDVHVTAMLFEATKAEIDNKIKKGRASYEKGSEEYRKAVKELYEEVIEQTQANYDVLHRSNIQRDERFVSKQLTLFKTDAFINSNILYSSAARWAAAKRRGNKTEIKAAGKAFGKAVASQLAANATLTLMTIIGNGLLRHKMDDYLDENGEMTWGSFIEEVLWTYFGEAGRTLTLLPSSVFDVFSFVEKLIRGGYTNVTTDLLSPWLESFDTNVTSLISAFVGCFEKGVPVKDKLLGVGGPLWELGTMAAEFFGVPAGNITDMFNAVRLYGEDIVQGITGNSDGTYAGYERKNKQKYRIMYDAVIAGDKKKYDRYEKEMLNGKSATHQNIYEGVTGYITGERVKPVEQSKIDSGIAEHLAKNDELRTVALHCLKQDWYNYTEGFGKLEDMGFNEEQILKAEKKVTDALAKLAYADPADEEYTKLLSKLYDLGLEDEDIEQGIEYVKSFAVYDGEGSITSGELKYSYKMLAEAVVDGDVESAVRMYTYLTGEAEKESKTIRSQLTQYIKPIYKKASNTERSDIRNFLMKNCGYKYGDFEKWLKD